MNCMQKADEAVLTTIKSEEVHSLWLVENNLLITTATDTTSLVKLWNKYFLIRRWQTCLRAAKQKQQQ